MKKFITALALVVTAASPAVAGILTRSDGANACYEDFYLKSETAEPGSTYELYACLKGLAPEVDDIFTYGPDIKLSLPTEVPPCAGTLVQHKNGWTGGNYFACLAD